MLRRWRVVWLAAVIGSLGLAAAALGFFTSSGSGTGSANVGNPTAWTVTPGAAAGGPIYPGAGSQTIPYTVKNAGSGYQELQSTSAVVASSGGNVTQGGLAVSGCLASWFTVANTPPAVPSDLAPGASASGGSVAVSMQDSGTDQNACQGVNPDITISAS